MGVQHAGSVPAGTGPNRALDAAFAHPEGRGFKDYHHPTGVGNEIEGA
jgi:hypothetical protein